MAASDARPIPRRNVAYRITFPIFDADGDLVTGAAGLDSEVSKDGGTFADCTNEAVEIATSSGVYYLDLSASEMDADTVAIIVKTSTSGAKTTPIILYPEEAGDLRADVVAISGDATAADSLEAALDGTGGVTLSANLAGYAELRTTGGSAGTNADELVDLIWDEVLTGAAHNVSQSAGRRLRELSGSVVTSGTAQAGATASITLASGASSTDGTYDPSLVRIVAGTGAGQARLIIQYVGSTRVASVDRDWRVTPDATSEYEIIASPNLISTNEGLAQGGTSTSITLNALASATNDAYVGQLVVLRTGTGQDQSRLITAYNGTTKVATVAQAWQVNPVSGTGYLLWPLGRSLVAGFVNDTITSGAIAASAVTELQSGLATAAALQLVDDLVDDLEGRLTAQRATNLDNLDAAISTRATPAQVGTEADAALADVGLTTVVTGRIDAAISSRLASAGYTTPPTAGAVADAVWDEVRTDHATSGTFGQGAASVQGNVTGSVASVTAAVTVGTNNDKTGYALTVGERDSIAAALLDLADGVETGYTVRGALRLIAAALAGELSGAATTTIVIRNITDTKARITATVDADGNRTALTLDAT